MEICPVWSQFGHSLFWAMVDCLNYRLQGCGPDYRPLKLSFIADRPPPSHIFEQVALMAAEESGE
jgi:hypothetical protein